ncbi:TPA: hypothetical protein ACPFI9_004120 [Providencia rettgeri]
MKSLLLGLICLSILSGCATKNYGRQGVLTDYEKSTMTCREIEMEQAKIHGYLQHVEKESEFDGRSVLSFLGDFGIGNTMEKNSAIESANKRMMQLQELRLQKKCNSSTENKTTSLLDNKDVISKD